MLNQLTPAEALAKATLKAASEAAGAIVPVFRREIPSRPDFPDETGRVFERQHPYYAFLRPRKGGQITRPVWDQSRNFGEAP